MIQTQKRKIFHSFSLLFTFNKRVQCCYLLSLVDFTDVHIERYFTILYKCSNITLANTCAHRIMEAT